MSGVATTINKSRHRGDTYPIKFVYSVDGAVADITGYTFTFTLDTEELPDDPSTTVLFSLAGVITDAAAGEFEFRPTSGNMDRTGLFYYDVVMNDGTYDYTIVTGELEMIERIKDV